MGQLNKLKKVMVTAAIAGSLLGTSSVNAQTVTGTMAITAAVADSCIVSATALPFGTLSATALTNDIAPAVISVICTSPKVGASIAVDGGGNVDSGQRRLSTVGSTFIPYNVFSDAARTASVAVDGDVFTGDLTAVTPNLINVYGQIPAGAYAIGAYTDVVTLTLTY